MLARAAALQFPIRFLVEPAMEIDVGICHSYLLGINVVSSSKCIVLALQVIIV